MMLYRKMKKHDVELSALGFGCMRLPVKANGKVNRPEAIRLIRHGIDAGINYVDTAYVYHMGESETVLGDALRDGYREKTYLATKLPTWLIRTREDMDQYLGEQLRKLQTDHVDFYLIHGLGGDNWEAMRKLGVGDFLDDALADGRIRYAGFSFHDQPETFAGIVDGYDWTFAQIQYNYMDEGYQAGTEGLRYAASKGLDVVVMEPLRGGMLTSPPPEVEKLWKESGKGWTPAQWGLRWVWDHSEVTVVLSGMNTMAQLEENLKSAENAKPDSLTAAEKAVVAKARAAYRGRTKINCTGCAYCQPCPNGVGIPGCFKAYNNFYMYDNEAQSRLIYDAFISDGMASKCIECGECEEKCPQGLPIRDALKDVVKLFGK